MLLILILSIIRNKSSDFRPSIWLDDTQIVSVGGIEILLSHEEIIWVGGVEDSLVGTALVCVNSIPLELLLHLCIDVLIGLFNNCKWMAHCGTERASASLNSLSHASSSRLSNIGHFSVHNFAQIHGASLIAEGIGRFCTSVNWLRLLLCLSKKKLSLVWLISHLLMLP